MNSSISSENRIQRAAVAFFLILLFVIGLIATPSYGLPCDEQWEQQTLLENACEYTILLCGEDSDAANRYAERGFTRISLSTEKDHGQCAYYPLIPLLNSQISAHTVMVIWHVYTWLWFFAGVWVLYLIGRRMGLSRFIACLGCVLLYLCPRFFAEGHYNSKDMILLCLVLLTLYFGLRFLDRPSFSIGIPFAFFGAMATNTKIIGALAFGLIGIAAIIMVSVRKEWCRQLVFAAVGTVALFIVIYTLLTPAALSDPIAYFKYLITNATGFSRWPGVVLFDGIKYDHAVNPLPRSYLPKMIIRTLPIYILPLAAIGQISLICDLCRQRCRFLSNSRNMFLSAAILLWVLPLGIAFILKPLVYNGWRHFYFIFAGIVILSVAGLDRLLSQLGKVSRKYHYDRLFCILLCLLFTGTASGIAVNFPYEYAYYNLYQTGNISQNMELDYWDVSTLNVLDALAANVPSDHSPIEVGARDDMSQFGIDHAAIVMSSEYAGKLNITENPEAEYLFYNTTYARIYEVDPPEGYHEWLTVYSYNSPICTLWQRDQ